MSHNKWTETEIQMLKDNYKTMTDDELSELISNHSKTSIVTQRRRLGLTRDLSITPFDKVCEVIDNYGYKLLSDESDYINGGSLIKYYDIVDNRNINTGAIVNNSGTANTVNIINCNTEIITWIIPSAINITSLFMENLL